ncbi:MAG: hypothetical protein RSD14_04995 [Clostridia bacterium]
MKAENILSVSILMVIIIIGILYIKYIYNIQKQELNYKIVKMIKFNLSCCKNYDVKEVTIASKNEERTIFICDELEQKEQLEKQLEEIIRDLNGKCDEEYIKKCIVIKQKEKEK